MLSGRTLNIDIENSALGLLIFPGKKRCIQLNSELWILNTVISTYLAVFWSNSSHHWLSSVFLTGTPTGGSHTHSPVLRLANMCSCNKNIFSHHFLRICEMCECLILSEVTQETGEVYSHNLLRTELGLTRWKLILPFSRIPVQLQLLGYKVTTTIHSQS